MKKNETAKLSVNGEENIKSLCTRVAGYVNNWRNVNAVLLYT